MLHLTELSYITTYWATLHPTELCCALLSYTAPCGATLHPPSYPAPNWTTYPCNNFKSQNVELSAFGQSSNRMKNKCRRQNQFGTGIRGLTPVPKSIGAGLRWRMPECQCRRHWPWCQCPMASTLTCSHRFFVGWIRYQRRPVTFLKIINWSDKEIYQNWTSVLSINLLVHWTCLACLTSYIFPLARHACLSWVVSLSCLQYLS